MFYHDVHICVIRVLILSDFLRSFKMRNMAVLARRVYCLVGWQRFHRLVLLLYRQQH